MMNPHQNDPVMAKVWQDGYEYGHYTAVNTTSHGMQNASPEVAQESWDRQQSGDEEFWNQFEESPLSGEWADGPRIEDVLAQAGVPVSDDLDYYDYREDAARVWMDGYSQGLSDGHEAVIAPLAGKMDEPGSTFIPNEWTTSAWQGQDDGWGQMNPENDLYYHLDCPNCGSDQDYRESALPIDINNPRRKLYHCAECGEYSDPDGTPGSSAPEDVSAQDLEDWPVLPEHQAATNPVNYDFVPFADGELAAYDVLPRLEKQRWHARAFNLNRRALKSGQEGRVTGRELYALIHRHDNQCAYCDKPLEWSEPGAGRDQAPQAQNSDSAGTIDHNVPLNLGGPGSADNLLPTCWHCNKEMNQWDRRNFDKNLAPPRGIQPNPLLDTEPVYAAVHEVQVKCPNCGTLGETEVCQKCGKGLEPEWNKLDQGKDVPWESLPQMGTPQDEFRSWPTDAVPKVNWGQQDNQFGTMISHVRTAVDDSENWMVPDAPPAYLEGHGDTVRLQGQEVNRYLEDRFPDTEYTSCPQCGEKDMMDTNLGHHCLNCDYWEEDGKDRKDQEFLATPDGQAYSDRMRMLEDRASVNEDEFL